MFGLLILVGRLGDIANSVLTPILYSSSQSFNSILILILTIGILILISSIYYFYIDNAKINQLKNSEEVNEPFLNQTTPIFWLLSVNCIISYQVLMTTISNIYFLIHSKYKISITNSGFLVGISNISAIIFIPIVGFLTKKYGKKLFFLTFSTFCFLLSIILLALLPTTTSIYNLVFSLIIFGVFLATYQANIWALFPMIIEKKFFGKIKGAIGSFTFICNFLSSIFYGVIFDASIKSGEQFFYPQLYLIILLSFALSLLLIINYLDFKGKKVLN